MKKLIYITGLLPLLMACSSIELTQTGSKVMVSPTPAPTGCKFIAQVVGNQGNFFTGDWTSNKNLEEGAMNDMKNKAAELGANYVQLLTNKAGQTGSWSSYGGSMDQTNVTNLGNAYKCPESAVNW
jgi:uncharacterized protein YbjQ (UPF0145 family)